MFQKQRYENLIEDFIQLKTLFTLRSDGECEFLFFRHPSADMLLRESEIDTNHLKQVYLPLFG